MRGALRRSLMNMRWLRAAPLVLLFAAPLAACKSDHGWKGKAEIASGAERFVFKPGPCGPPDGARPGSLRFYDDVDGSITVTKITGGYTVAVQRSSKDVAATLYMGKAECSTFDIEVKPTGESSHDRTEYGGHVKLSCKASGRDVTADITFEDCR